MEMPLVPGLRILAGPANTAVFERHRKRLLIDAGDPAPDGTPVEWVLFTHHHRDRASAAPSLAALRREVYRVKLGQARQERPAP
jgi:glyoxylase-like metal-dependent hydrolase (beta-lactamase superfamily II)